MNSEHILTGRWIEAMGLMALPRNAIDSLKCLAELTDGLWYLAGDKSSDVISRVPLKKFKLFIPGRL